MRLGKRSVCCVISDIEKSLVMERWLESIASSVQLSVVLIGCSGSSFSRWIETQEIEHLALDFRGLGMYPGTLWKLAAWLRENKPQAVHCHLRKANLLGLPAALLARVPIRIFTRHHGSQHLDSSRRGVLEDKVCSLLATQIVAPSLNIRNLLVQREGVSEGKIALIHHGFSLSDYAPQADAVQELKQRHEIRSDDYVVGAISRFVEGKGVDYIVQAFLDFQSRHPQAVLVLANATGPGRVGVEDALRGLCKSRYRLIPFEEDVSRLYGLFDVFVHVPTAATTEAFGQVYVESLAAGVPCVFTRSGVANEFNDDDSAAVIVPYRDAWAVSQALERVFTMSAEELCLRRRKGREMVEAHYSLDQLIPKSVELYGPSGVKS